MYFRGGQGRLYYESIEERCHDRERRRNVTGILLLSAFAYIFTWKMWFGSLGREISKEMGMYLYPPPPKPFRIISSLMHLSMLSRLGGRPGIDGGFDSSHRPVGGTFDRFNGLSSNSLLTFSCYFDNPQMPCGRAFGQKLSAQFKSPA